LGVIVRRRDHDRSDRRIHAGGCIGFAARRRRQDKKQCSNAAHHNAPEHFDVPEHLGTALDRALPAFVEGRNESDAAAVRLRRPSLAANSRKQRQGTAATLRTILSMVFKISGDGGQL